jgi:phytoene dehydrogenase-like protein
VERNIETGGGLVTQEIAGFKMNYHATYMMLGELMPPYADLELGSEGVRFTYPEAQVSFLFANKKSFTLFRDAKRSVASVAELSAEDAGRYAKLREEVDQMCDDILIPATFAPPVEPVERMLLFREAGPLGERMADISEMTPLEYIESFGFRDTRVKAGLFYLTAMFGLDLEEGGMGFMACTSPAPAFIPAGW